MSVHQQDLESVRGRGRGREPPHLLWTAPPILAPAQVTLRRRGLPPRALPALGATGEVAQPGALPHKWLFLPCHRSTCFFLFNLQTHTWGWYCCLILFYNYVLLLVTSSRLRAGVRNLMFLILKYVFFMSHFSVRCYGDWEHFSRVFCRIRCLLFYLWSY